MMLHGYCLRCHKIKRVRVQTLTRVPMGVCTDCEAKR